jgi:DNA-binding NarL/FixJ family response regulator
LSIPHRVFIVDDHPLIISSIELLLQAVTDLEVVGTALQGTSALSQCIRLQPDLLILDLHISSTAPLDIITTLQRKSPRTRVLIASAFLEKDMVALLMSRGVAGYLMKAEASELLVTAVRTVVRGASWFSEEVLNLLRTSEGVSTKQTLWHTLSPLEQQLLQLMGQGYTNQEIAEALHFAPQTIRNYSAILYRRLGVKSRAELMVWLRRVL